MSIKSSLILALLLPFLAASALDESDSGKEEIDFMTDQMKSSSIESFSWIPLLSALIGAIIGSMSTYYGNSLLQTRNSRYDTYSKLQGKKRVLGQIYFSLISERFMSSRLDAFRIKCGKASDPMVMYELKRHTESADKYQFELNELYSEILELLSSIELVYKKSEQIKQKINNIIKLNEAVNSDQEKMMKLFNQKISERISAIQPKIEFIIEPNNIKIITTYNADILSKATDPIFNKAIDVDLPDYINRCIQWPFDDLLNYLKNELQGKDNEELQVWRIQCSP